MKYPTKYEWLGRIGTLPRVITEGLKEYGTLETPGKSNNQKILDWADEADVENFYTADSIPWCGLFVKIITKRAGKPALKNPLWALNWAKYGTAVGQPCLGDILVFQRDGGGHVGFYIGEDSETYHVLGGNQNDSVCITRIYKKRLFAARRPKMFFRKTDSTKPYILSNTGTFVRSTEA